MTVTTFLFYLSIIFLQGIVWALSDRRWGYEKTPPAIILVLKILLFGVTTYCFLIIFKYFGWLPDISKFVQDVAFILTGKVEEVTPEYELLILSIPVVVVLTLIWLYLVEIDAFTWFLTKIRIIKTREQSSFMSAALECPQDCVLILRIWDFKNGRSFKGVLGVFEESLDSIQILLNEVEVCDIHGNVLFNTKRYMYSCETKNFQFDVISIKEKK